MIDWPHQTQGVADVLAAIHAGHRRIVLTSPTGMGKSRMAVLLAQHYATNGQGVVVYTNRRMLLEQLTNTFSNAGLAPGVRAAGHISDHSRLVQIASIPTEYSRSIKRQIWDTHHAQLVIVDEGHLHTKRTSQYIINCHIDDGASVVYFTATPLGMKSCADLIIHAGTKAQGRACGALVPAHHFGPDEPDLRHIKRIPLGQDLTEEQNRKAIMVPGIFGRVLRWFRQLNPQQLPTILFAPGVKESVWFTDRFQEVGIPAAHIDGNEIYINGTAKPSTPELREQLLQDSKSRRITILCNRFVLREGIDAPWLGHGILACVFGSLQSYLQAGGRLLRAYPGLAHVTIQDHGGNWWRHGSLNDERIWNLADTNSSCAAQRFQALTDKKEAEPFRCPQCAQILRTPRCPCGFVVQPNARSRPVIQKDGSLIYYRGDIFKPRKIEQRPDTLKLWMKEYYRARNSNRTFRQAIGYFIHQHGYEPPRNLPGMPLSDGDWFARVRDVPTERLHPFPNKPTTGG